MKPIFLSLMLMSLAGTATAQERELSVTGGLKFWRTQWTTFGYYPTQPPGVTAAVLTQDPAKERFVMLPVLSVRYRQFLASVSGYQSTGYETQDGTRSTRSEFDANVGYLVLPGLALTAGYKKLSQRGDYRYEPKGLVLGISATAPLGSGVALYGAFGFGRLKTPGSSDPRVVQFDADYRVSELGLAYSLAVASWIKTLSFTAGYRSQVLSSKEALGSQDGRDLTHGLAFAVLGTF